MKKILIIILVLGIGIILVVPKIFSKGLRGVSLSPKSFSSEDFLEFWDKAKESGSAVTWAGRWEELKDPKSAPHVVATIGKQNNLTPIIIISAEVANGEDYKKTVSDFAQKYKPKYLGLGNEINYTYRNNPSAIESFSKIFSDTYHAVKEKSPKTKIFTVFQYETPQNGLDLASKFSGADLIAFTTYPEIVGYKDPSQIPDDYYTKIKEKIDKPIAFSEIGWQGQDAKKQAEFVTIFFERIKELKAEFIIWPFLYDQKDIRFFTNMGLIDASGKARPALEVWKNK